MIQIRSLVAATFLAIAQPLMAGLAWETTYREIRAPANQKEVLADFAFRNDGPAPLTITSLQTSCGCTTARADPKEVPPGAKGAVNVRFDVGGRKGEQVKSVAVMASDHTKQTLVLKVVIEEPITFNRRSFEWAAGSPPSPQTSVIEVDPASGAQILGAESLNDQFEVFLQELEPGRRYQLRVTPRSTDVPVTSSVKVLVADPKKRAVFLQTRVEN